MHRWEINKLATDKLNEMKARFPEVLAGWTVSLNERAKRRLGCCKYSTKTIELSSYLADINLCEEEVMDTILHEIAHAVAGSRAKHGYEWKVVAYRLGCKGTRTANLSALAKAGKCDMSVMEERLPYVAICPVCHVKIFKARKPRNNGSTVCKCLSGASYATKLANRLMFGRTK